MQTLQLGRCLCHLYHQEEIITTISSWFAFATVYYRVRLLSEPCTVSSTPLKLSVASAEGYTWSRYWVCSCSGSCRLCLSGRSLGSPRQGRGCDLVLTLCTAKGTGTCGTGQVTGHWHAAGAKDSVGRPQTIGRLRGWKHRDSFVQAPSPEAPAWADFVLCITIKLLKRTGNLGLYYGKPG